MKNLFVSVLLFSSFALFSQETTTDELPKVSKHELSIVVDDFLGKNQVMYSDYSSYYYNPYGQQNLTNVGLGYRFHFQKSAIRARFSLGYNSYNYSYQGNGSSESSFLQSTFSIGYELHKNMGKAQFFYGLDLLNNISNSNSISRDQSNVQQYLSSSKRTGYGVAPLMGIKYHFSSMISVSTELRYLIESYKQNDLTENINAVSDYMNTTSGVKTKFGPAGFLSINIHF